MATGVENRLRGGAKRNHRCPLVILMVCVAVVAVTTFISIQTAVGFSKADWDDEESPFSTWTKVLHKNELENKYTDPYTPMLPTAESSSGWSRSWVTRLPGVAKEETFYCERYNIRSDVCHMHGIVQLVGNSTLVLNAVEKKTRVIEELISPYTRKWEKPCMDKVAQISLQSQKEVKNNLSRLCEVWHEVPAVVFSTGGYTGNVYHEFNDGLIPLYITIQHLKGEVIFVIVDYHDWWMARYWEIVKKLSNYEVIVIANNTKSHCFSDVTAGLYVHGELSIDQSLMPEHESIQDFRALLNNSYPLEDNDWEKNFPTYGSSVQAKRTESQGNVLQVVIINREGSRAIVNLDKVIELATGMGFDVTVLQPDPTTEMKKIFWLLDRCDVLIGVHGAALTHFLFMRPGTAFIQIVPLGTDWAAKTYYGDPAINLGLNYIEYKITVGESTLSSEYNKTHPILVNPKAVGRQQGWSFIKEVYLGKQKVDLSLPRFYMILLEAKAKTKATGASWRSSRRRNPRKKPRSPPNDKHQSAKSSQRDELEGFQLSDRLSRPRYVQSSPL